MRKLALLTTVVLIVAVGASAAQASSPAVYNMTTAQLYKEANKEVNRGGIYSHRWGGSSRYLTSLCYEALNRAFAPYGTQGWARYVVNRESGCNIGAINTTYSSWSQQAHGIAQYIPAVHTWVDYRRLMIDLKYAIATFVKMSHGGRSTSPWNCC